MEDTTREDRPIEPDVSHYEYSGIDEHHGIVPRWLLVVCAALVIWSIYYLFQYWREPGIGGFGG